MKEKPLKKLSSAQVTVIKLKNRRGFAAIALNNLTEGNTAPQAFQRLHHPLRRLGFSLPDRVPSVRSL